MHRLSTGENVLFGLAVTFATQGGNVRVADLFMVDKSTRQFVAGLLAEAGL